jgi:hypothetical protein
LPWREAYRFEIKMHVCGTDDFPSVLTLAAVRRVFKKPILYFLYKKFITDLIIIDYIKSIPHIMRCGIPL